MWYKVQWMTENCHVVATTLIDAEDLKDALHQARLAHTKGKSCLIAKTRDRPEKSRLRKNL